MGIFKFTNWKRRVYTTNAADPTAVTTWKYRGRLIEIQLCGAWGVESNIYLPYGYRMWSYDHLWAKLLFDYLEDLWQEDDYDEDPMGYPGEYR